MQFLLVSVVAAVAIIQTSSVDDGLTRSASVLVRGVVDGETIDVATIGRVRLLGIDAPRVAAPFGHEARERLAALVLRRWVRLDQERRGGGIHGRQPAYVVRDDGVFVNAVLVREGYARVQARASLPRRGELDRAEAEARLFRRGIWSEASPGTGKSYTDPSNAGRSPSTSTPGPFGPGAKSRTRKAASPKKPKAQDTSTRARHSRRIRLRP